MGAEIGGGYGDCMTQPIRIQRKRTKGYNLQADSLARNGLPCVYVGRPSCWGNPYTVGDKYKNIFDENGKAESMEVEAVVGAFKYFLKGKLVTDPELLAPLVGKNLACWCKEGSPCHADILLELANR